jgi:hypothetical protein
MREKRFAADKPDPANSQYANLALAHLLLALVPKVLCHGCNDADN